MKKLLLFTLILVLMASFVNALSDTNLDRINNNMGRSSDRNTIVYDTRR